MQIDNSYTIYPSSVQSMQQSSQVTSDMAVEQSSEVQQTPPPPPTHPQEVQQVSGEEGVGQNLDITV